MGLPAVEGQVGAASPRAVASVERDLEELLSFDALPQAHWRKVRTTHIMERGLRAVRRRTRPMSSFTNPAIPQSGTDRLRRQPSLEPLLGTKAPSRIYTKCSTIPRASVHCLLVVFQLDSSFFTRRFRVA